MVRQLTVLGLIEVDHAAYGALKLGQDVRPVLEGERRLAFVVGGADGLDPAFVAQARETLAFGPQTWPHALARAMLAEQVYRAVTILAGSPYHRD